MYSHSEPEELGQGESKSKCASWKLTEENAGEKTEVQADSADPVLELGKVLSPPIYKKKKIKGN